MVSMADDGGNFVLLGVDATYCVVDEVDTTSSTLRDIFLQEAIKNADTDGDLHSQDPSHDTQDPYLQAATKTTAESVVKVTDTLLKRKKRKRECDLPAEGSTNSVGTDSAGQDCEGSQSKVVIVMPSAKSSSSFLRAALLGKPVSLREPGLPGKLNFCLQRVESEQEADMHRHGDSPTESESSTGASHLEGQRLPDGQQDTGQKGHHYTEASDSAAAAAQVAEEGDKKLSSKVLKKTCSREKHYQCGVCERWFGCKSHVVEHMRTHTGEKPYKCPLCDRCFSQKSNIYQHMNTHTLERPFRCDDCGKDFMYRGSLYKHKRLHTGERPYCCGVCSWRFTHASQLFEHLRTHTNEKPFKCGVCSRAFAHSGTMHRHQRNHFNHLTSKIEEVEVADQPASCDDAESSNNERFESSTQSGDNTGNNGLASGSHIDGDAEDSAGELVTSTTPKPTLAEWGRSETTGAGNVESLSSAVRENTTNSQQTPMVDSTSSSSKKLVNVSRTAASVPKCSARSRSSSRSDSALPQKQERKVFSCDVCGKTFAHRRSVRRHKQSSHLKHADHQLGGQGHVAGKSVSGDTSQPTTTTVTAGVPSSNGHSVIRLLLARKAEDPLPNEASYVSKLIFGKCQPPAVTTPSVASREQNNNEPTLLKHLLASTVTTDSKGNYNNTLQSPLQAAECKTEPNTCSKTLVETQNCSLVGAQHGEIVTIKQEPVDS